MELMNQCFNKVRSYYIIFKLIKVHSLLQKKKKNVPSDLKEKRKGAERLSPEICFNKQQGWESMVKTVRDQYLLNE